MKKALFWTSMLTAVMIAALAIPVAHSASGSTAEQRQPSADSIATKTAKEPASGQTVSPRKPSLESQVDRWIATLAKEKQFEEWKNARWESYPLGPGTHGWLILLHSGQKEIGYLIVGDEEAGNYKLLEYGSGDKPLFGMETLYQSLMQLGLILETTTFELFQNELFPTLQPKRLYKLPLQAVWQLVIRGETIWLDAKSGEKLPDLTDSLLTGSSAASAIDAAAGSDVMVTEGMQSDSFDPFERPSWVKGKSIEAARFEDIRQRLKDGEHITFSGKWFGGKVIYPLAVIGYQVWTGDICYLGFDQDGTRFAPYGQALSLGSLYQ